MPLSKIEFAPGIVTDDTSGDAENTWINGSRVRFVRGRPQTIGGWQKRLPTALSGVPRGLYGWENRTRDKLLGLGTHSNLYVVKGGGAYNVTPAGLAAGNIDAGVGGGFGTGLYGTGAYGSGTSGSTFLRHWSLDSWGDYMLAVPRGGALYEWQGNTAAAATLVPGAPSVADAMFVDDNRYVVLLGTQEQGTGQFNPKLVRWSDQDSYTIWNAAATNKAGEFPLNDGGRAVAGRAGSPALIWTDTALYQMRLLDADLVFGFTKVGANCGLIGSQAVAERDGLAFWMGSSRQFFGYAGGAPEPLTCPLTRDVFDHLNTDQADKIVAAIVSQYNEVWFLYPDHRDGNGLENSRYISYNWVDRTWARGELDRTSWLDGGVFSGPLATNAAGVLYDQEYGASADGAALVESLESGAFDLDDGEQVMRLAELMPDFEEQSGIPQLTIYSRYEPHGPEETHGPYALTPGLRHLPLNVQGRQARFKISGATSPSFWRYGAPRWNIKATGMKR